MRSCNRPRVAGIRGFFRRPLGVCRTECGRLLNRVRPRCNTHRGQEVFHRISTYPDVPCVLVTPIPSLVDISRTLVIDPKFSSSKVIHTLIKGIIYLTFPRRIDFGCRFRPGADTADRYSAVPYPFVRGSSPQPSVLPTSCTSVRRFCAGPSMRLAASNGAGAP